jgi:hypothetical protein
LTSQEQKELIRLSSRCIDPKDGEAPLPDADKKDLKRLLELSKKAGVEPENDIGRPCPVTIKGYVQSDLCKQMVADGAQFQGVEQRNHGTHEKPVYILREWLYVGKGEDRKAVFIQYRLGHGSDARAIEAGRTIAASAYQRFAKP